MSSRFSCKVPESVIKTCYEHEGIIMPYILPLTALQKIKKFECRPDDMFIVTYPKAGTTWVEQLALLIKHDGDVSKLEGSHVMLMVPFLEVASDMVNPETSPLDIERAEAMPSPRILKSHCHSPFLPPGIGSDDPKSKVIYLARNPKDTAVSYYHFCHLNPTLPSYESWDVFFEEFLAGRAPQGSWFENVLPWWRRRNHPNVLFLKYEDMKRDLPAAVKQIAEFMGKSLTDDVIEKISNESTFEAMRKNPASNPDSLFPPELKKEGQSFMRKGIIGDWKNYFSDDQNKRFDELYKKEMAGSGLKIDFE